MSDLFGTTGSKATQAVIDAASKILMGVKDDETAKAQTEDQHPAIDPKNQEDVQEGKKMSSKEKMAIRDYGVNVLGYTPQEMDSVYDYRVLLGLRNAWMYDKTLKATKVKPTEKKAVARTARPGTSNVPKSASPVKKAKQRLAKSGKVQDAAKLFEQII